MVHVLTFIKFDDKYNYMIKMYGIVNCNTVKKARNWLKDNEVEYEFHDYKKLGIDRESLLAWCNQLGWEVVLNRRGMMWRKASEEAKNKVVDTESAIEFMIQTPTSIKRPVITDDNGLIVIGFDEDEYNSKFR